MISLSNATARRAHRLLRTVLSPTGLAPIVLGVSVLALLSACGDEVTSDHCSARAFDAGSFDAGSFDAGPVDAAFDAPICIICGSGESLCASGCADTKTSTENCGGCGIVCGTGESCVNSRCTCGTETGSRGGGAVCTSMSDGGSAACCSSTCVDLETSETHCSACDNACNPGEGCFSGFCQCGADMGVRGSGPICTSSCFSSAGASTLCADPTSTTCSCSTTAPDAGI